MHAYGRHWACQLVYNPKFHEGMGLADHEGVKHFWSRIRKLIPLTRGQWVCVLPLHLPFDLNMSQNSQRIWMIDQYAAFVSAKGRAGLGNWIHRQQHKNVTPNYRAAMATLQDCQIPVRELRVQWEAQRLAQTSIHACKLLVHHILLCVSQLLCIDAPACLRRELDKVLLLQNQINAVEKAIDNTKKTLKGSKASPHSHAALRALELTHARLSNEAEELYVSLNIQETFPELRGLPLEFTQTLLLMWDLKINIRERAVGSFFKWESLDHAVSGRREALGL
jgi:hypothetical protein